MDATGASTVAATRTATTAVAVACLGITAHLVAPSGRAGDLTYLIGATAAMVIAWAGVLRRAPPRAGALRACSAAPQVGAWPC